MWIVCFFLSLGLLIRGVYSCYKKFRRHESFMVYAVGYVFAIGTILYVPIQYNAEAPWITITASLASSLGIFVIAPLMKDFTEAVCVSSGWLKAFYQFMGTLIFIIAPLLTFACVLQFFSSTLAQIYLWWEQKRNCRLYVFSEINERALATAENLRNTVKSESDKVKLVFCGMSDDTKHTEYIDRARKMGAILLKKSVEELDFYNDSYVVAYFEISENMDQNVTETLKLLDQLQKKSKEIQKHTYIYCYSIDAEAEILLDGKEAGDVRVILLDEGRESVYHQIFQHPLFTNMNPLTDQADNKINILILGGGKIGTEFLKASLWAGQMQAFKPEIHLMDKNADEIESRLKVNCPELYDNTDYHFSIKKGDALGADAMKLLKSLDHVDYCVCSLGDDEANIHAGLMVRRHYYLKNPKHAPYIAIQIQNQEKYQAVWDMHVNAKSNDYKGKKLYYGITPFGNSGDQFNNKEDTTFLIEYLAMGVNMHYCTDATDPENVKAFSKEDVRNNEKGYYDIQSNRRSSIANAIHMKSKLWEMGFGIMKRPENYDIRALNYWEYIQKKEDVKANMIDLEHRRWMAFQHADGWRLASRDGGKLEDISKCVESYKMQYCNQNYMMMMHPALVPTDAKEDLASLKEVEQMIAEVTGKHPNYLLSDEKLINFIGAIVEGSWFKEADILVHGSRVQPNQCGIYRLEDMVAYYKAQLSSEESLTDEMIQNIRENIRYCCYGVLHRLKAEGIQIDKPEANDCSKDVWKNNRDSLQLVYQTLGMLAEEELLADEADLYHRLMGSLEQLDNNIEEK